MFKIQLVRGMIVLAQNKETKENKEIVFLGSTPSGEYVQILDISSNKREWFTQVEFEAKYELLEFLGF
jgi:hypothetical protein